MFFRFRNELQKHCLHYTYPPTVQMLGGNGLNQILFSLCFKTSHLNFDCLTIAPLSPLPTNGHSCIIHEGESGSSEMQSETWQAGESIRGGVRRAEEEGEIERAMGHSQLQRQRMKWRKEGSVEERCGVHNSMRIKRRGGWERGNWSSETYCASHVRKG